MEDLGVFVCGCIFFPACFTVIRFLLYNFYSSQLTDGDVHNVTEKYVDMLAKSIVEITNILCRTLGVNSAIEM